MPNETRPALTEQLHGEALNINAMLEDFQWQSTGWLRDIVDAVTSWTGADSTGWNGLALRRAVQLLKERGAI